MAAVRAKAGIADGSYDGAIDALIAEQLPALEATLIGPYGPEANLGATEIVTAELLDQIDRAEGGVQIGDVKDESLSSAGLRSQGWARLAPHRRDVGAVRAAGPR